MRRRTTNGLVVGLAVLLAAAVVWAEGNIDPAQKFAWSENAGWVNFAPTNGGVTVTAGQGLSGYAWAENLGWIQLAAVGSTYQNTTKDDWGVRLIGTTLHGFAWSENAGWVNFAPQYGGVTIQSDGRFDGYAWGENVGWMHFKNATPIYGVRTTASLGATLILIR